MRDEGECLGACRNSRWSALTQPLPDRSRLHRGRCHRAIVGRSRRTGDHAARQQARNVDPARSKGDVYDYLSGAALAFKSLPGHGNDAAAAARPVFITGHVSDDAEHEHHAAPTVSTVFTVASSIDIGSMRLDGAVFCEAGSPDFSLPWVPFRDSADKARRAERCRLCLHDLLHGWIVRHVQNAQVCTTSPPHGVNAFIAADE